MKSYGESLEETLLELPGVTKASEPPVTTDPVKAIAERTVLTFRDRLILEGFRGYWKDPYTEQSPRDLVRTANEVISEMAKVKS